jgi:hypothetical protein
MAKQTSIIKFVGTIGGVTGYLRDGKHFIKSAEANNPTSEQKKRKNNPEFGEVSKTGRLIREVADILLCQVRDGSHVNRLTKALHPLIQLDTIHPCKERKILKEHLHLIKGFEFNQKAQLKDLITCPYEYSLDEETGIMNVFFPPFIPAQNICAPRGATHFRFEALGCAINLEIQENEFSISSSNDWLVTTTEAIAIELRVSLPLKIEGTKILMLAVLFFEEKSGDMELMKERNGMRVVEVKV